jgi:hypothetical protein
MIPQCNGIPSSARNPQCTQDQILVEMGVFGSSPTHLGHAEQIAAGCVSKNPIRQGELSQGTVPAGPHGSDGKVISDDLFECWRFSVSHS